MTKKRKHLLEKYFTVNELKLKDAKKKREGILNEGSKDILKSCFYRKKR